MRPSLLLNTLCVVTLVGLTACGGPPAPKQAMLYPAECEILRAPKDIADSLSVALPDAVKPEVAPWARNASERLLFHHFYETLITIDCVEDVQAGLAASWKSGDRGHRWTFELREDARFWDGSRVTARDVVRSWRDLAVEPKTIDAVIDSVTVAGERTVHVYLRERHRRVPRMLSGSMFAVVKPSEESDWLLGSGPYRIVASQSGASNSSLRSVAARPAFRAKAPVITFIQTSTGDARDLLEAGIDLIVTDDPAVLEYAARRPQLATVALPWKTTYVLLSTSRILGFRSGDEPGTIPPGLSDGIARDAVRGDARGCTPPSWWDDVDDCIDLSAADDASYPIGAPSSSSVRRILYDEEDPNARDLAERLVALAAADPDGSPDAAAIAAAVPGMTSRVGGVVAEGVAAGALERSLAVGDDFAYIVPILRRPSDPCYEARRLLERAPWLGAPDVDFSEAIVPLVDTRPHAIVTRNSFGLIVDWYGNILIANGMSEEK